MQLKKFVPGVLLALMMLTGCSLPSMADVVVNEGNGVNITMENQAVRLNIAVEAGGRISSLVNKKTGKDLVALWKGGGQNGGLLDDRNVFTDYMYRAAVMKLGEKEGVVRLSARHPSGMSITKVLTLRDNDGTLYVEEIFSNGTQKNAQFMLRSFLLPGGGPQTDDNQYFLPVKDKPLEPLTPAHNYFDNLSSPWSAVWNKQSGEGVLVAAPGIEKFYFWQESKISPTYEWIYPEVPAGKSIVVNYALRLINDAAPDWAQLSAATLKGLRGVRLANVPGWQNEEQRFQVVDAERARGFWFSTGEGTGKRRLPEKLQLDVPLGQTRSAYIAINALKDYDDSELTIDLRNVPKELVQLGWQVSGVDFIKVLPFDSSTKIKLKNGTEGRLWLTLKGGDKPVDADGEIEISLGEQGVLLPLKAKVWPVNVPRQQPFDIREYAGIMSFVGGYNPVNAENTRQANAIFRHFNDAGGNVLNWAANWGLLNGRLKIAGTDESVSDWLKKNREAFMQKPAVDWPKVDFSHYAPWVEAARSNGVTRVTGYLPLSTPEKPVTVEHEWMLIQLKAYLESQGFHGFFCKIDDEIAAEHIPAYIEAAKIAHRAGWKAGTTVTGSVARSAEHINTMNPYCDIWEVGLGSTEYFRNILTQRYRLEEHTLELPAGQWGNYGNGGAQETVAQKLFNGLLPAVPAEVEDVRVFQNGKLLHRAGGSAWGNKRRGVFFAGANDYLYLSPFEGTDAKQSKITVQYQRRIPSLEGKTLAQIDPGDEVWFYGGPGRTYRVTYETAATYPLKAIQGDYDGVGWYDFYRWTADKVIWYDPAAGEVSVSPPYLGLRDGWNDAGLVAWLTKTGKAPVSRFISEQPDAPLRIGEEEQEIYRWKNIVNLTDPFALNDARRKMLEVATLN